VAHGWRERTLIHQSSGCGAGSRVCLPSRTNHTREKFYFTVSKGEALCELPCEGGRPWILFNAWDAGSANTILDAGAKAIATSSWSVAEAQGYRDGEFIPLGIRRTDHSGGSRVQSTRRSTVDLEGGYSEDDAVLAENVTRLLDLGIIGINFEDRVVHGEGPLYIPSQSKRIKAIREVATKKGVDLFINARTDVFFAEGDPADFMKSASIAQRPYAEAGASVSSCQVLRTTR